MLPVETVLAMFPSAVVVGNLTLRPLTLAHVAALEALGVDTQGSVTESQALLCGWMLTQEPDSVMRRMENGYDLSGFEKWVDSNTVDSVEILEGVRKCFRHGTICYVPAGSGDGKKKKVTVGIAAEGTGYGWPLEIAECFAHEYGCSFDDALRTPMSRIFGMLACGRQRNGGEAGGPDYYERIFHNKIRLAKIAARAKKVIEEGANRDGRGK